MAETSKTTRNPARAPAHPGALLREVVLPDLGVTKSAFAAAIKMSRDQLHLILTERQPITLETAVNARGRARRLRTALTHHVSRARPVARVEVNRS